MRIQPNSKRAILWGFQSSITLAWLACLFLGGSAWGEEAVPFKKPKFVGEPDKRPEEVIDPDTYVQGLEAPPEPVIPLLSARPNTDRDSQAVLGFGICYLTTSSDGRFVGTTTTSDLSTTGTLQLCGQVHGSYRPAGFPLSLRGGASFGKGSATLYTTRAGAPLVTNSDLTEVLAHGELAIHLWSTQSGQSMYEVMLLGGGAYQSLASPVLVLSSSSASIDSRKLLLLPVGLGFRISPTPNWFVDLSYRRLIWMSARGSGDVRAESVSHSRVSLEASRYILPGVSVQLTGAYEWKSLSWRATSPETYVESHSESRVKFALGLVQDL